MHAQLKSAAATHVEDVEDVDEPPATGQPFLASSPCKPASDGCEDGCPPAADGEALAPSPPQTSANAYGSADIALEPAGRGAGSRLEDRRGSQSHSSVRTCDPPDSDAP